MNRFDTHLWGRMAGGLGISQALLLLLSMRQKKITGVLGTSLMALFCMVLVFSGNRVWRELEPQQRQQRIEFRNGKQCGGDDYIYVDIGRSYSYSDSGGFSSH